MSNTLSWSGPIKRTRYVAKYVLACAASLLVACGVTPFAPQEKQISSVGASNGVVDDWTHHHVVFSNPGTMENATNNDAYENWHRIVTDPRYRIQWIKRYGAFSQEAIRSRFPFRPTPPGRERVWDTHSVLGGKWSAQIGPGGANGGGVAIDMYPAKYSFAPNAAPSCSGDFVVFGINASGSSSEANVVALTNLYSGCTGTVPNYRFGYFVGTGAIRTSTVLSQDGTKLAFVESISGGSKFHVLTIGTTGNNGSSWSPPVAPCTVNGTQNCTTNNAVDTYIVMSGGVSDTRSSPFVDYSNDTAYVGDDSGKVHKFTHVFLGTPTEVTTTGWPFTVASGVILTAPVHDATSGNVFVGGSNGNLYCINAGAATAAACSTASVSVASGTNPVLDAPVLDSTTQTVFAEASNTLHSVLMQATTSLGSVVRVTMGAPGTDLYNGTFDNAYFNSVSSGHMYFCGNAASAATPTLYRVGFNSSGTVNSTNDGNSLQLVATGNTGTNYDCTPLTEVYNGTTDYLFLGVRNGGFPSAPNCAYSQCVLSFSLPTSPLGAFPTGALAGINPGTNPQYFMSGIIIDNISTTFTGASQIYYSNLGSGQAVQLSQSGLN